MPFSFKSPVERELDGPGTRAMTYSIGKAPHKRVRAGETAATGSSSSGVLRNAQRVDRKTGGTAGGVVEHRVRIDDDLALQCRGDRRRRQGAELRPRRH